jgi:large subunit ribosomal protein L1
MAKRGKNIKKMYEGFNSEQLYTLKEAIALIKKLTFAKFDETCELAINLGVDPRHADQNIRGAVSMPNGLGKTVRILAFCQGEDESIAKEAGADYVGGEDLMTKIQGGWIDFDRVVSTPDMMRVVGRLGKILGPRGMMPTPKTGTVTKDVGGAIKELKAGKVQFKVDKKGVLHAPIGKISFSEEKLEENILTLVDTVKKLKPISAKGTYIKKFTVSSTMGPGIKVDTIAFR